MMTDVRSCLGQVPQSVADADTFHKLLRSQERLPQILTLSINQLDRHYIVDLINE